MRRQQKKKVLQVVQALPPKFEGLHHAMTEITRLHISPLTPEILPSVLPPSLRSIATDISFHEIPTFPENSYGYITLPSMDADKIKKKLNGSILKGKKFKVETARPSKRPSEEAIEEETPKESKKSKKRKTEDGVLDGFELPPDRKVKRGWTEPANAKKDRWKTEKKKSKGDKKEKLQPKSKYSENPECLFRTKIPPNRSSEKEDDKKSKKKKKPTEPVVHEFSQTVTHPSFLRDTGDKTPQTTAFEEGKGWVDNAGNVKEAPSEKSRKKDYKPGALPGSKEKKSAKKSSKVVQEDPKSSSEAEDWTSSSGSSDDESSDSESEANESSAESAESAESSESVDAPAVNKSAQGANNPEVSPEESSGDSSEDSSEDSSDDSSDDSEPSEEHEATVQDAESKEVHPLEALFKRPKPDDAKETPVADNAGFSFFGNNDDIESEEEPQAAEPQTPFTPFTKKDLQVRGLRSAAPTPDTSMAGRHVSWSDAEDIDDEDLIDTPLSKSKGQNSLSEKDETEFAKWFWENRGDNNRAWKKRRRDAAKEQRQRENRKKGMKGKS